jgi:hypothetical protein
MSASWPYPSAAPPEPLWFTSLAEAMPWAQTWDCPLVVVFAAHWCQWSLRLWAETLADVQVKAMLRTIACAWIEGDNNLQLLQQWGIDIYPTSLVLAPDGSELGRIRGFEEGPAWATRLHEILMGRGITRQSR